MKFITPLLACSALSSSLAAEEFLDERFDYPDGALLSGGWFDTTSVQVIDGSVVHSGNGDGTGTMAVEVPAESSGDGGIEPPPLPL